MALAVLHSESGVLAAFELAQDDIATNLEVMNNQLYEVEAAEIVSNNTGGNLVCPRSVIVIAA